MLLESKINDGAGLKYIPAAYIIRNQIHGPMQKIVFATLKKGPLFSSVKQRMTVCSGKPLSSTANFDFQNFLQSAPNTHNTVDNFLSI